MKLTLPTRKTESYTFDVGSQKCKGRIKVMVVDPATGKIEYDTPWQKNLLLTQGLNNLRSYAWVQLNTYMVFGDGNTPTSDDSGAITASQSGTTVTLSGSLAAVSANKLIRWDSGVEAKVVSGSGTSWEVDRTASVGAGEFTVYRIDQTGLANELGRSNTYLTGEGNCGTSRIGAVVTHRTTYDSAAFGADKNVAEIGFAAVATVAANLNYRILLAGGAITVATGKILRVIHDQIVTYSPVTNASIVPTATGWPVARACTMDISTDYVTLAGHGYTNAEKVIFNSTGTLPTGLVDGTTYYVRDKTTDTFKVEASVGGGAIDLSGANGSGHTAKQPLDAAHCLQHTEYAYLNTSRGVLTQSTNACLEPMNFAADGARIHVATDATALGAWGDVAYDRTGYVSKLISTDVTYVAGSGTAVIGVTFLTTEANLANIRSISLSSPTAPNPSYRYLVGWTLLFSFKQIKENTATLRIRLRITWDRDLSA